MRIAVATLNRYLKQPRTTEELAALIMRTEIELEQVLYSIKLDPKIVLVKILEIYPHPQADRLRLVTVTDGKSKHKLVCGAPNLIVGQRVAYVQPGTKLPDGSLIEAAMIRGEESAGMLASGKELGLSDDHEGLWVLESTSHRLGTSLCDIVINGDVLDIKTPTNRWDYLSGEGIARELAVYDPPQTFLPVSIGEYDYSEIEYVDVKSRAEAPRFTSAKIRIPNDVKTPQWLVDNLSLNGIVSHHPVVDITNWVMLELGQPTHAYDASTLSGPLSVRFSEKGEKITTLDDVERVLTSQDLVVCDARGPVGLAGIMGSANSQISAATTEVVLETAIWDKTIVRRTALHQGLRTEASARFERGLPLPLAPRAMSRMLDLLIEICQAEIIDGPFDQLHAWPWQQLLGLRLRRVERLLGHTIDEPMAIKGLRRMGFGVEHFSITKELKSHLGKPYVWGANYRQDGESGFDCSYLVDRVFSKIGVFVGHTALGQIHHGKAIAVDKLKPGDVLFVRDDQNTKAAKDHYYTTTPQGTKQLVDLPEPMQVGHTGVYIGNGELIHARRNGGVVTSPVEDFTKDDGYLGARRYVESFNHLSAVVVPWWRPDVRSEADLTEEIGKIIGYDQIPNTLPDIPAMPRGDERLQKMMQLRRMLSAAGLTEVMTYSFISEEAVAVSGIDHAEFLPIANPRSPEQAYVRASILPSHVQMWSHQSSAVRDTVVCFELSSVFSSRGLAELPREHWQLGISARGENGLRNVQAALHRLMLLGGVTSVLKPDAKQSNLIAQRSARIIIDDQPVGLVGQVASVTLGALKLKSDLAWAEVELEPWFAEQTFRSLPDLPAYQLVARDVSLELAEAVWWQAITEVLAAQSQVWSVEYVDEYQNESLRSDQRRVLTLRLLLDSGNRPSTQQIEAVLEAIHKVLLQKLPAADLRIR